MPDPIPQPAPIKLFLTHSWTKVERHHGSSPMGWSFRKSFGKGPLRFNLSKSGGSISFGSRAGRICLGSSGAHVSGGAGPYRYRQKISAGVCEGPDGPVSVSERTIHSCNCPHCGQKHNFRSISAETIRSCDACARKFTLPKLPAMTDDEPTLLGLLAQVSAVNARKEQNDSSYWTLMIGIPIVFFWSIGALVGATKENGAGTGIVVFLGIVALGSAVIFALWRHYRERFWFDLEMHPNIHAALIELEGAVLALAQADLKIMDQDGRWSPALFGRNGVPEIHADFVIPYFGFDQRLLHFLPDCLLVMDCAQMETISYQQVRVTSGQPNGPRPFYIISGPRSLLLTCTSSKRETVVAFVKALKRMASLVQADVPTAEAASPP